MRCLLALLAALLAVAVFASASLAAPRAVIRTQKATIDPGAGTRNFDVDCPEGWTAVTGYIVEGGPAVFVFESTPSRDQHIWHFEVRNRLPAPIDARFQVRCVKLPETIDVKTTKVTRNLLPEPGQIARNFVGRCPRGYGPAGVGFAQSPLGKPGQEPPEGGVVNMGELEPVKGGVKVSLTNIGFEAVRYVHYTRCIERKDPGIRNSFVRVTTSVELAPGEVQAYTQRCPPGKVSMFGGLSQRKSLIRWLPFGYDMNRGLVFIVLSGSPTPEPVDLHALCFESRRRDF